MTSMTSLKVFLYDLKFQVNHKIQAGLDSEPLKNVAVAIEKELQKIKEAKQFELAHYVGVPCEICGEKAICLSVLCSQKYQAHYVSGNKMICTQCLIKGDLA